MHESFITEAASRGAGLAEDCYELSVLRMFRREYVAALPEGEKMLSDYEEQAPKVIQAIYELSGEDSQKVWACLYVAGIIPAVLLITSGKWDEAYGIYRSMCEELDELFLEGGMEGYAPDTWLDAWIEAKLADTPAQAREVSARGGVMPLEDWCSHGWRLHRTLRIQEADLRGSHA